MAINTLLGNPAIFTMEQLTQGCEIINKLPVAGKGDLSRSRIERRRLEKGEKIARYLHHQGDSDDR